MGLAAYAEAEMNCDGPPGREVCLQMPPTLEVHHTGYTVAVCRRETISIAKAAGWKKRKDGGWMCPSCAAPNGPREKEE